MRVVLLAALFNVFGLVFSRKYVETGSLWHAAVTTLSFGSAAACWCWLVRVGGKGVVVSGVLWDVCSTLLMVGVGLWYRETLSRTQLAGVALGVVAVGLLAGG